MGLDNEYSIDLVELQRQIQSADVVCIYFPMLRRTLILDSRAGELDAPTVLLAPMVANAEERLRAIQELRPRLGQPEAIVMAPWPKRVRTLESSGMLKIITAHFDGIGAAAAADCAREAFRALLDAEREDIRAAIVGENYQTFWSRS